MPQDLKIIGKIEIPEPKVKEKCTCDRCGTVVDSSCGDPRIRLTIKYANGKIDEEYICEGCNQADLGEYDANIIPQGEKLRDHRYWAMLLDKD